MKGIRLSKIKLFEPFFWVYYVWYYLPIARAFFMSSTYNILFFGFFVCGCILCVMQTLTRTRTIVVRMTPVVPVLAYFIMLAVMTMFDVATAGRHIRVSFTFWGTLIAFYLMRRYPEAQKRLGKLMLVMLLVTAVTSIVGVVINPRAARILTYSENAIEEDLAIRILNIGGIAFFQGLVILVPILVSFMIRKRYRVFCVVSLAAVFVGVMAASFTISLALFFLALLLGWLSNNVSQKNLLIGAGLLILGLVVPWEAVFTALSGVIENESVSTRFLAIANSISSGTAEGNLESRVDLYKASLDTFLSHPLGVGPHYTYVNYENGIGYHSQILDDLARYGVFAAAFYVVFFMSYYRLLKEQWGKIHMQQIAWPVVVIYFCFLMLNPGFTSEHESVLMLFLIPILPELLGKKDTMLTSSK